MTRGTEAALEPLVINGWTIYAHPLFLQELEVLAQKVEALRKKNPKGYKQKNATKRLAAIRKLAFTDIPEDPAKAEYRHGGTLGEVYTHWFRAKFFQQYRLFFRFHAASKLLVLVTPARTSEPHQSAAPFTWMFCPDTQLARSVARNTTTSATSDACPSRLNGVR